MQQPPDPWMTGASDGFSQPEKIAPASVEAEEAVLGSILINPEVIIVVLGILQAADFFIVKNGWVWEAMLAVHNRGYAIDILTVIEELRNQGRLDQIGGSSYITWLINNCPTHIHAETYAKIVERAAMRRRLLSVAGDIAQIALEDNAEIDTIVEQAESALFSVTNRLNDKSLTPLIETVSDFFDLTEKIQKGDVDPGLPTGFPQLDELTGGLTKQDTFIVAARPGVGKTGFLLSIAVNAAKLAGARVGLYSLEMSIELLMRRMAAMETGIDSQKFKRKNGLNADEWALFTQAMARLSDLPIFIDDTPAITPNKLAAKSRKMIREQGLDLIVVDYLQLMKVSEESKGKNREQEVSYISAKLKEIAREMNVPVLAAAQINREVEKKTDKRPQLADLRESGSIENDASAVMFIYRGAMYEDTAFGPTDAQILLKKNRNGPEGDFMLNFNGPTQSFTNKPLTRSANRSEVGL
jgi:replicative DNA helicase